MSDGSKVNVLLIGGGAREHALAWKLRQSPRLGELFTANPENPGISALAKPADVLLDPKNPLRLQNFCIQNRIGLAVIGPEEPLAAGLADVLLGESSMSPGSAGGLKGCVQAVFGPSQAAAQLESDKVFAKDLMRAASVPTADSRSFTDFEAARAYLESRESPQVIKAAGLAKGKGVFVPANLAEAVGALETIMRKRAFGDAGAKVLIEERLKGREVSVFALVDGRTIFMLEPCQDHKRLSDGATGPNTGGMGSLCPSPALDDRLMARIQRDVIVPTIDTLKRDGVEFRGVLYAGIMLTPAGPKVLEFNVRFGDPECQTLMARLRGDLLDIMLATSRRELDRVDLSFSPGAAVCIVLAAEGYPDKPRAGSVITGIEAAGEVEGVQVFIGGATRDAQGRLVTSGGRVLSVTATGADVHEARARAYRAAERIQFAGKTFRTDIGTDVVG